MPESIDLRFFITAVLIQREIGGNLAEILDSLGHTIRERFKLIGQLNAQTAQAKMSGIVLALAPVVIGSLIWLMNPSYMKPLFSTLIGQLALSASVLMGILGFFCIKYVTNIKV
jgi:tight adherence protein B